MVMGPWDVSCTTFWPVAVMAVMVLGSPRKSAPRPSWSCHSRHRSIRDDNIKHIQHTSDTHQIHIRYTSDILTREVKTMIWADKHGKHGIYIGWTSVSFRVAPGEEWWDHHVAQAARWAPQHHPGGVDDFCPTVFQNMTQIDTDWQRPKIDVIFTTSFFRWFFSNFFHNFWWFSAIFLDFSRVALPFRCPVFSVDRSVAQAVKSLDPFLLETAPVLVAGHFEWVETAVRSIHWDTVKRYW